MKTGTKPKRLLSMLLALMMVLTLLPTTAFAAPGDVEINKTNFPDDIFREYVDTNFDTTDDNILTAAEIAAVLEMTVTNKNISTLKGVEYFTALTRLECGYNHLTSLDVSKNTALIFLWCNDNQLTSLDLSKNTALYSLECQGNRLTSLDVSKNTALKGLFCAENQLTSLDVSNHTALQYFVTDGNARVITLSAEKTFDLSTLPGFDVSKAKNFVGGTVSGNILTATAAEITYDYDCGNSQTASFKLKTPPAGVAIDKTNFPDDIFRAYVYRFDTTDDDILTAAELAAVKEMTVTNKKISTLKGVEYFTALTDLDCRKNQLTSLDLSKNTALNQLFCDENPLTSLDVSKNTALTYLVCGITKLTSLDVSKNTALKELSCEGANLTSLDVSNNTALTSLYCKDNQLTSLNMSKNTALIGLSCDNNQLASLDLSKNTALTGLHCADNQLTSLDLSKNTALTELLCYDNQLTSLDLSKNTALYSLECQGNRLTSLDLSKNTALGSLDISNNVRAITLSAGKTFDLSTLPGFDVNKASNFVGGTVSGNILTATADEITYDYDCGNSKTASFKLVVAPDELAFADNVAYDIPAGKQGSTYTTTIPLTVTGGKAPYTFTIAPTGIGLDINGENKLVFTRPAETAATTAIIKCRDAANNTKTITIAIGTVYSTVIHSASATVTAPKAEASPATTATPGDNGDMYSVASVSWEPSDSVFAEGKSYTVLVTLKAKDGLKFAASPVAAINGKTAVVVSGADSEELKIRYTFPQIVTAAMPFVDVPDDAYYKDAVLWAVDKDITTGISATTFSPNGLCTRAHAVTFLWRANGSPAPKTTAMPFHDVPAGRYYYNAVLWAVEQGIVKGTSATAFSPNANCSRAQIVTMQWRMEGSKSATVSNPFTDVASSAYYADAVLWAVDEGITEGTSATTFSPNDNCTRAQIVTFIYRDMK